MYQYVQIRGDGAGNYVGPHIQGPLTPPQTYQNPKANDPVELPAFPCKATATMLGPKRHMNADDLAMKSERTLYHLCRFLITLYSLYNPFKTLLNSKETL